MTLLTQEPRPATETGSLYRGVQRTLVYGMTLSFSLMGLGLLAALLDPSGSADEVVPLHDLPAALLRFQPGAFLALGVLVLMFIPAVHLLVALIWFLRAGDRRYAALSGLVLLLLVIGAGLSLLRG